MRFTLIKQNLLQYTCKILLIQLKDRFIINIDFLWRKNMVIEKQMRKNITLILPLALLSAGLLVTSCGSTAETKESAPKSTPEVSAYIRTWPIGARAELDKGIHWTADQIHGEYLQDIIISFALIDQNDKSTLYVKDMEDQESEITPGHIVSGFKNLWQEVDALKKKFPHLKINLSVGGWGAEFSDTAYYPETRTKFIANVIDWLEKYKLDGVDIDWEYPVGPEWGMEIKTRPEDRENYISLLSELRTALNSLGTRTGKYYKLSTAVPASGWFVERNDVIAAAKIVDALKLMSYDYYGSWSETTGHHANLRQNPDDPAWGGWSTAQAVDKYLEAGVPADKLVLGLAFYGRAWKGVPAGGTNGLFQKFEGVPNPDSISWGEIENLLQPGSGYTRYWDNVAKSPFLYNSDTFISYTDPEAIKLIIAYVKEKKLGGVMYWEYAWDMEAKLLKVVNENLR